MKWRQMFGEQIMAKIALQYQQYILLNDRFPENYHQFSFKYRQ